MNLKRLVLAAVIACTMTTPVSAMTTRQASAYLNTLMEHILENYAGETPTVEELYTAAAKGMTEPLDQFSEYLSAAEYDDMYNSLSGNFKGIGIQFSITLDGSIEVIKVIDNSPAKKSGLLKGDIIRKVDGTSVNGYTTESLAQLIANAPDRLTIEVMRDGAINSFTMTKAEIQMSTVEYGMLSEYLTEAADNRTIGYIEITQIGERTAAETKDAVNKLKSGGARQVVLDLRGNPGGLKNAIDEISAMFVPKGVIYSTIDSNGNKEVYSSQLTTTPFKDVVILVDGDTASASELFASAMQDSKAATIIGQRTYGKGIIQSFAAFPTGDMLKYTSMEYLRRSGQRLHGIGITPDIVITKPQPLGDEMLLMNNDGTGMGMKNCNELLTYIGYNAGSSDKYTEKTKAAVMDIQKRAKLNPTGAFDLQTIRAINTAYNVYVSGHDEELIKAYEVLAARGNG